MVVDTIQLSGLVVMLGGMLFYLYAWLPLFRHDQVLNRPYHLRISRVMLVAGGLYLLATLFNSLLAYLQYTRSGVPADVLAFLSESGWGLAGLIFVPVILAGFNRLAGAHKSSQYIWPALAGMILLLIEAKGSNAASGQGLLPFLSNTLHLLAAITWAGGICALALVPWGTIADKVDRYGALVRQLDQRFYNLVLALFIVVVVSGAMLAFVHVHSVAALYATLYGKALILKLVMVSVLTLLLTLHLLKAGGMLERLAGATAPTDAGPLLKRYCRLVYLEVIVVIALLAGSAAMRDHPPPDTAPFLNPQTLSLAVSGQPVRISMQPVAGNVNGVRMEIFLPPQLAGGDATQVFYSLSMPDHPTDMGPVEAIRVSADSYQGEAIFPVPGDWQIDVTISRAGAETVQTRSGFPVPSQPLVGDITTYLSLQAILYNTSAIISFVTGLFLVIIYSWLALQGRRGGAPQWLTLISIACILFGAYLQLSVALVKTYPSTYMNNPLPLSADVITRGQQAYAETCAECHGQTGKGDGPWAIENRGSIPDLGSPHMDVHTDGEIFWWITRGIPELDMPAREVELTPEQRWELVNYIRSLRHGSVDEG